MPETLAYSTTLDVLSCGTCEIPFAMPSSLHRARKADGGWFYCPSGHKIHYFEDENARLRKELERAERQRDWAESSRKAARDQAEAAQRSAAAYRGVTTRLRKRAAAGVCPCCHRSFRALRDHMASQHPDFTADPVAAGECAIAPRRAHCRYCASDVSVNPNGLLRRHYLKPGGAACEGSGRLPGSAR